MIYIARVTAAIDDAGTTTTLLFGNVDWTTGSSDTPANTQVRGRLIEPGNYRREISQGRTLFGYSKPGYGVAKIALHGGDIDAIARYGFGWRRFDLFAAPSSDPYATLPAFPGGWVQVLGAVVESAAVEFNGRDEVLSLALRDPLAKLDKPVCATYAGTGGMEGPSTLAGQAKPRVYGQVCNVKPQLIDSATLTYQVSDRPAVQPRHAYDKRSALTPTSSNPNDAADLTTLQALSIAGGSFARCSDAGLIRTGSTPDLLTVDAIRHDVAYATSYGHRQFGPILSDLFADAGLTSADYDAALVAIDAAGGASIGQYIADTSTTYLDVLSRVAASRGAWVSPNRLGVLTGAVVVAPSGTPVWEFVGEACASVAIVAGAYPVPVASAKVRGGYNWTTMTRADVAGISVSEVDTIGKDWTFVDSASGSARTKHLNASDETLDTYSGQVNPVAPGLPGASVGFTAESFMDLHGVERDTVEVTVAMSAALLSTVDLGSVVRFTWGRMGFDAGRLMLVIGARMSFAAERITFVLWG